MSLKSIEPCKGHEVEIREARMAEAKWWADEFHLSDACDLPPAQCIYCSRLIELVRNSLVDTHSST